MEKDNPLTPFWYDGSRENENKNVLNIAPRDRRTRDENAGGTRFHTRVSEMGAGSRKRSVADNGEGDHKRHAPGSYMSQSDLIFTSDDSHFNVARSYNISSHPSYSIPSSESVYHFAPYHSATQTKIPSSPPRADYSLQSSPQLTHYHDDFLASQTTVVPTGHQDSDFGSETTVNFNVTPYNRIEAYINSDEMEGHEANNEGLKIRAQGILNQAIENGDPKVYLDSLGLKILPNEIGDLKNLVYFGKNGVQIPQIEIYAQKNELKILPHTLFDITNIKVLSLRNNMLKRIPGKIQQLQNLTDLSLISNELKVLPFQILKLPKLVHLLVRPNYNLIERSDQDPETYFCVNDQRTGLDVDIRRYVSNLKWHEVPSHLEPSKMTDREIALAVPRLPTLTELTLRKVSMYQATHSETIIWKRNIPIAIQLKMAKAMQKGIYEETCSVCDAITVNPVAKALEWWDFKSHKEIPVRRNFCCGRCVLHWLDDVEGCRKSYKARESNDVDYHHDMDNIQVDEDF